MGGREGGVVYDVYVTYYICYKTGHGKTDRTLRSVSSEEFYVMFSIEVVASVDTVAVNAWAD